MMNTAVHARLPLSSSGSTNTTTPKQYFSIHIDNKCTQFSGNHRPKPISISSVRTACASSLPATDVPKEETPILQLGEISARCEKWIWRGHTINYLMYPPRTNDGTLRPALFLVHGFGASVAHWRRCTLLKNCMEYDTDDSSSEVISSKTFLMFFKRNSFLIVLLVYAIDLLGFGASDKPKGFEYSMELWAQLLLDFLDEIIRRPSILIGNSVGSLACVIAAKESAQSLIQGLVLLNCAGGMNNKAIVDDWRIKLILPLLWLVDFLLKQRGIASYLFDRVRQRENIRNILMSVYGNKESVDEDLVEIIQKPAYDDGALDAFVSIVTGPPGPNPVQLMPQINFPVLVLWGDQDPFTPLDGPVGKYFSSLPSQLSNISLSVLEGTGHCPHDDRPDLVHEKLLPWLAHLPVPEDVN